MVEQAFVNIEDLNLNDIFLTSQESISIDYFAEKIKKYPNRVRVYVA